MVTKCYARGGAGRHARTAATQTGLPSSPCRHWEALPLGSPASGLRCAPKSAVPATPAVKRQRDGNFSAVQRVAKTAGPAPQSTTGLWSPRQRAQSRPHSSTPRIPHLTTHMQHLSFPKLHALQRAKTAHRAPRFCTARRQNETVDKRAKTTDYLHNTWL